LHRQGKPTKYSPVFARQEKLGKMPAGKAAKEVRWTKSKAKPSRNKTSTRQHRSPKVGDTVVHKTHGRGTVKELGGQRRPGFLKISFDTAGLRSIKDTQVTRS